MPLLSFSLPVMWLIILVVLGLAEAATVTLVSIWFAIGALVSLLVSLVCTNFWVQLVVFLVVSALCLALMRPIAKKKFTPHLRPTNLDLLIGKDAVVTEDIDNLAATGQVKVGGQVWSARNETEVPIPAGTVVVVLRIEGVKIIVRVKDPDAGT